MSKKEAIKNLLVDFMADYDSNCWSNDDVYEKYAEKINKVRTMDEIIVFTELTKKVKDLEAKLAESEEKYEEFKQVISKCTGELPPNVAFDIANDDIRYQIICNLTDRNQEHRNTIKELKQQLAEKEKSHKWTVCKLCEQEMNQDKISFAVEKLEKVKELVHNHIKEIANDLSEEDDERLNQKHTIHGLATAITYIDNQIKQLKENVK